MSPPPTGAGTPSDALRALRQVAETQDIHRNALMVEQRPLPMVQSADRRQARRRQAKLDPKVLENGNGQDLERVQCAARHPQEADL
jgi:hypothetical protein